MTEAQQALRNSTGTTYQQNQITTFCGNRQKVNIAGGIAYYDPEKKAVRKVTGTIYNTWNENCTLYGLPENDTTRVTGYGGTGGFMQRFVNGNKIFDFYQKDWQNAVILEGPIRDEYNSMGGISKLGFPQDSSNTNKVAVGRCGSSGNFWETDNARIYRNGNQYHTVVRNTLIGQRFFNNGADTKYGLPLNDETTQVLYSWQDFFVTRIDLWWPGGTNETYDTQYCPSERPEEWENILKNSVNNITPNTYNRASQNILCGDNNTATHPINNGLMLINKSTKVTTQFKGDIYTYWNTNGSCERLGKPTEISYNLSKDGINGEYMRFSKDNKTTDIYSSSYGVVELEGELRNAYNEQGGFNRLGFITSTNNTYNAKCGQTGTFNNIQKGRMYRTSNGWRTVLSDTKTGAYYFNNGADSKFGIPKTNQYNHGILSIQEFNNVKLVSDLINTWEENYTNCDGENVEQVKNSCVDPKYFESASEKCINRCKPNEEFKENQCMPKEGVIDQTKQIDIVTQKNYYAVGEVHKFLTKIDVPNATQYWIKIAVSPEALTDPSQRVPEKYFAQVYRGGEVDIDFSTHALFRTRNEKEKTRKLYYILEVEGVGSSEVKGYEVEMRYFKEVKIEGVPILKQGDYGGAIASAGCAVVSTTMLLNFYGLSDVTPWSIYNAQNGVLMLWQLILSNLKLTDQVKFSVDSANPDKDGLYNEIRGYIDKGTPVIAYSSSYRIGYQRNGIEVYDQHFVLIIGYNSTSFITINPTWGKEELVDYNDQTRKFQLFKGYERI